VGFIDFLHIFVNKSHLIMINVKCKHCEKEEIVSPSRAKKYIACSMECYSSYRKSLNKSNCTCTNCSKEFYKKLSVIKRYNRSMGIFCSMKCSTEFKKSYYKGDKNPNYRGRQYDQDGYRINHYPKIGRVKEHHYITFMTLGISKIPEGYCVHHKDCNIYNNIPENLCIISESDHRWIHKQFGNATLWAFMNNKVTYEQLVEWSNDKEKCKLLLLNLLNQKEQYESKN
jgi:hypothetical protein